MKTSTPRLRWPLTVGAAIGVASVVTACSQLVGADFNVTLGSTVSGAGGSGGGAVSSSSGESNSATGVGGGTGAGGNGCGGMPCPPETVAMNQDFPWGLVIVATSVYWTSAGASHGTNIVTNDGAIRRRGIDGGDVETVLDQIKTPDQIASDGEYLYWTSTVVWPDGVVYRCLISGCVREAVALNQASPTGVTVRGAYVYWASGGDGSVSRRLRDQQADGGGPRPRCWRLASITRTSSSPTPTASICPSSRRLAPCGSWETILSPPRSCRRWTRRLASRRAPATCA